VSLVCYSIAWLLEGGSNHKAGARSWFWSGLSASHLSGDPLGVLLPDPEESPTHGPCLREGRVHDWRSTEQSPTSGSGFDVCQWRGRQQQSADTGPRLSGTGQDGHQDIISAAR